VRRSLTTALVLALSAPPAFALDELSGAARARGPDTVVIGGARVRLSGLDPTPSWPSCANACGEAAIEAIGRVVAGRRLRCQLEHRAGHGVYLGSCALEDGGDLALALLSAGLAQAGPDAPAPYRDAEKNARKQARGFWSLAGDGRTAPPTAGSRQSPPTGLRSSTKLNTSTIL
jgi:endonuclease YncB( thermonuclease family)